MAHNVKCLYCGKTFDRDLIPFTKPRANRYAHIECDNLNKQELVKLEASNELQKLMKKQKTSAPAASLSEKEKQKQELLDYVSKLFGSNFAYVPIKRQIEDYNKKFGYTYTGMLKALVYFYEVKNNSIEKSNYRLGIIPYVYQDAYNYYYNIFLINQKNQDKEKADYMPVTKEVIIKPRKQKKKNIKLFNVEIEEVL